MKTKIIALILLLVTTYSSFAQPMPPSTPEGNPIPVGNFLLLGVLAIGAFISGKKLRK